MGAEELIDDETYKDNDGVKNGESNDSSSSYSNQRNNGNKFFNNPNSRRKNDDVVSNSNVIPFRKPNSIVNGTNSLNKKIRSQAKEKPKQVNLAKPSSKNPKDFLRNSVNKAKNTISSIHNNKNRISNQSNNEEKNKINNSIGQLTDTTTNRPESEIIPKVNLSKINFSKLTGDYDNKIMQAVKKVKTMWVAAALSPVILLLLIIIIISSTGTGSGSGSGSSSSSNTSISNYSAGTMTDKEFYQYLVENAMIDPNACVDENGEFTLECDVIKFFLKLKSKVNNEQVLTIYYAMAYNRDFQELYSLHSSDEFNALIENKDNLKDYINGEYLTKYRSGLGDNFDLYSHIKPDIYASDDNDGNDVNGEFSIDSQTGFKMRISRAERTNTLFYEKNLSKLEGECVWYVLGRANEILSDWGVEKQWTYGPNGGEFCNAKNQGYTIEENDIDKIEQGSIISWKYEPYGHVAIVEKVNRDSSGKVESIVITEGGLGYYNIGKYLVNSSDNFVFFNGQNFPVEQGAHRDFVNLGTTSDEKLERRQALCESHGTGCQNTQVLLREQIANMNRSDVNSFCTIPLSQLK